MTPEDAAWDGNSDFYPTGKRNIKSDRIDTVVLAHISSDLQSQEFIKSLAENARKSAKLPDDDAKGADLRAEIKKLDSKINRGSGFEKGV